MKPRTLLIVAVLFGVGTGIATHRPKVNHHATEVCCVPPQCEPGDPPPCPGNPPELSGNPRS